METKLFCPGFASALSLKTLILLVNGGEGDSASILCRDREGVVYVHWGLS